MSLIISSGDLSVFKKNPLVIKEGCTYTIKIQFRVGNHHSFFVSSILSVIDRSNERLCLD